MRLLVLSDLHHEIWRERAPVIDPALSNPDAVILAGDIDVGNKAVHWAAKNFAGIPVFYVHGNHEAYGNNLDDVQEDIRAACLATGHVNFLDASEFIIGRVRFLGGALWTDFRLFGDDTCLAAMHAAEGVMNDYRRIGLAGQGYRKLRAADTAAIHARQKAWLTTKLNEPFEGSTVVVTHMAPSMQSVTGQFRMEPSSAAYASRMDELVSKADLWVHGHMHTSLDYRIGQCRVVCNPCGYTTRDGAPQNPQFDPKFVIDI
jgi:Icc-related predicted phosphoesterase